MIFSGEILHVWVKIVGLEHHPQPKKVAKISKPHNTDTGQTLYRPINKAFQTIKSKLAGASARGFSAPQ
jgi:hypothetical protein